MIFRLVSTDLAIFERVVRIIIEIEILVVLKSNSKFPRDNAEKDVIKSNHFSELHRDKQTINGHHRYEERPGSDVRREKPERVFVERDVPLGVLHAEWHRVLPDIANNDVVILGRFNSLFHQHNITSLG